MILKELHDALKLILNPNYVDSFKTKCLKNLKNLLIRCFIGKKRKYNLEDTIAHIKYPGDCLI